jgi:hypothetical protein
MKILKSIGIVVLVLVAIVVVGGLLLPRYVATSRSRVINAPKEAIMTQVTDLRKWEDWSPWAKLDPNMNSQYSESTAGVGAWMAWESKVDNVGCGKMTITAATPDSVAQRMEFKGMEENPGTAAFYFTPDGGGTKVTWTGHFDMGAGPIGRWFGLFIGDMIDKDYEKGLEQLATVSEKN